MRETGEPAFVVAANIETELPLVLPGEGFDYGPVRREQFPVPGAYQFFLGGRKRRQPARGNQGFDAHCVLVSRGV